MAFCGLLAIYVYTIHARYFSFGSFLMRNYDNNIEAIQIDFDLAFTDFVAFWPLLECLHYPCFSLVFYWVIFNFLT